jgi:uroporphyrinogen-III synthase
VLVTRPAAQAAAWVDGLTALGWPAVGVPLLSIEPAPDVGVLHDARRAVLASEPAPAAVMFVSPTAVQQFWPDAGGATWPKPTWAVATGPGTARALAQHGVPAAQILQPPSDAAAFDSEHVWPLLQALPWERQTVWIVRGEGGRDWLAARWREAGATVHTVVAYRRQAPQWTAEEAAWAQAACDEPASHVWLFSSSEALQHVARLLPASREVPAIATHPVIAQAARQSGFRAVAQAQPTVEAVVACLESGSLFRQRG